MQDLDATLPIGQTQSPRSIREVLPMRCLRCQGQVEKGTAPVILDRDGQRLAWESVPAWVCTRCAMAYFEPNEVQTIQRSVEALRALPPVLEA